MDTFISVGMHAGSSGSHLQGNCPIHNLTILLLLMHAFKSRLSLATLLWLCIRGNLLFNPACH